jgi:hypothetical protein
VRFSSVSIAGRNVAHSGVTISPELVSTAKAAAEIDALSICTEKVTGIPSCPLAGGNPHNRVASGGKGSSPWYADRMRISFSLSLTFSCALAAMKKQSKGIAVNSFILYLGAFFISTHSLSQQIVQQCQYSKNQ